MNSSKVLQNHPKQQHKMVSLLMLIIEKKVRVGRKPRVFNKKILNVVSVEKRTTIRVITSALSIGHSQVYRMMKSENIIAHTNSFKPKLSHDYKLRRLSFILSQIIPPTINTSPKFSLVYNVVHIDEK